MSAGRWYFISTRSLTVIFLWRPCIWITANRRPGSCETSSFIFSTTSARQNVVVKPLYTPTKHTSGKKEVTEVVGETHTHFPYRRPVDLCVEQQVRSWMPCCWIWKRPFFQIKQTQVLVELHHLICVCSNWSRLFVGITTRFPAPWYFSGSTVQSTRVVVVSGWRLCKARVTRVDAGCHPRMGGAEQKLAICPMTTQTVLSSHQPLMTITLYLSFSQCTRTRCADVKIVPLFNRSCTPTREDKHISMTGKHYFPKFHGLWEFCSHFCLFICVFFLRFIASLPIWRPTLGGKFNVRQTSIWDCYNSWQMNEIGRTKATAMGWLQWLQYLFSLDSVYLRQVEIHFAQNLWIGKQ